jgi:hypothetical protein
MTNIESALAKSQMKISCGPIEKFSIVRVLVELIIEKKIS